MNKYLKIQNLEEENKLKRLEVEKLSLRLQEIQLKRDLEREEERLKRHNETYEQFKNRKNKENNFFGLSSLSRDVKDMLKDGESVLTNKKQESLATCKVGEQILTQEQADKISQLTKQEQLIIETFREKEEIEEEENDQPMNSFVIKTEPRYWKSNDEEVKESFVFQDEEEYDKFMEKTYRKSILDPVNIKHRYSFESNKESQKRLGIGFGFGCENIFTKHPLDMIKERKSFKTDDGTTWYY